MNHQRLLLFVLLSITGFSIKAQDLSKPIVSELENVEKEMFASTSNGDSSAFRKICGNDYFTINANGESQNLEEAVLLSVRFKGSSVQLSEQKQRIFGNAALRTGRAKFYFGGQQVAEILYTSGWIYRDNRWQFIHWQGTPTGFSLSGKAMTEPPKN